MTARYVFVKTISVIPTGSQTRGGGITSLFTLHFKSSYMYKDFTVVFSLRL